MPIQVTVSRIRECQSEDRGQDPGQCRGGRASGFCRLLVYVCVRVRVVRLRGCRLNEGTRARARASEDKDEHGDAHWRSGILSRWVGPWGDSCIDFSRYSPGPSLLVCRPARAAWRLGGVAGLSVSEVLKIRRLSPTGTPYRRLLAWEGGRLDRCFLPSAHCPIDRSLRQIG